MSQVQPSTIRRTLHYFWFVTKKNVRFFILGIVATTLFILSLTYANTYVMSLIIDKVSTTKVAPDEVFTVFGPYLIALIAVNIVGQVASKLQDYATFKIDINGTYHLSKLAFDTLSNQSMTFHADRFSGSLVSQTSKMIAAYSLLIQTFLQSLLPTVISVIATVTILAPIVPVYVGVLIVLLVIYIAVAYTMFRKITPLSEKAARAQNRVGGVLSDSVTNILAVKTYGREDHERKLFDVATVNTRSAESENMRATLIRGVMTSTLIVLIMSTVAVFIVGGNAWFGISAGTLVMMFTYTYNLTMRFNMINSMLQRLNKVFGDASEMTRILDEPTLVEDVEDAKPLEVTDGSITFENLSFSYVDSGIETRVFEDLNLTIPAGQRVGLVGMSGSGKSTLTKLLLRLNDIQEGRILIDGQDISKTTQQSLRQQIAYVPQEALMFHRTVRENIAYGKPDATDDEVRLAADRANATEFIEHLSDGFQTIVGERGVKLSGGQRQRIAIARAILADAPILVLDEATSALDSKSEQLVQEALGNLMHDRTSLVVAHRLSTVASLDRILVLSNGDIVEGGSHSELLKLNGVYANLWDRQTGAFLEY